MEKVKAGIYRHWKGQLYCVSDIGHDPDTGERMVVYHPLYQSDQKTFLRLEADFSGRVERDGKDVPRFRLIQEWPERTPIWIGKVVTRKSNGFWNKRHRRRVIEDVDPQSLIVTLASYSKDSIYESLGGLLQNYHLG